MSGPYPDAPLTPLEEALRRLAPLPAALQRDRVMFEAGRASARSARPWQAAAATSALAAVALGAVLLFHRPAPVVVERTIVLGAPPPAVEPAPPEERPDPGTAPTPPPVLSAPLAFGESEYLRRRRDVIRWGVDVLPPPPPRAPAPPPLTPGSLRESERPGVASKLF